MFNELDPTKDTIRAYQHEWDYLQALRKARAGELLSEEELTAISNYTAALLNALAVVNKAARHHSNLFGSEYFDERGSISGTLVILKRMREQIDSNWNAFLQERKRNA